MCGIIGYIGARRAYPIIRKGLYKLEYRGYDSVGFALLEEDKLKVFKKKGRITTLEELLKDNNFRANLGIGHTRWATHGEVTDYNAHPHLDCKGEIALVHNGIVENFQQLKQYLIAKGHKFNSDTDSEVIAHLIEDNYCNIPLKEAVLKALKQIKGSYALAITSMREPNKLIGVRFRSPLILGVSPDGYFLASDVPALLEYTKDVIFLDDRELVVLDEQSYKIFNFEGEEKEKNVEFINWDISFAEKNGYPHFMLKEIYEQPRVLEEILRLRVKGNKIELGFATEWLNNFSRIIIVSCGTAYHAGLVGQYLIEKLAHLGVRVETSSEFRYRDLPLKKDSLFITISQSGETADTIAGIELARKFGLQVLSIVNVIGSTIARNSNIVIYTHAGPEIGVASTKAYLAQLLILYLLALELAYVHKRCDRDFIGEYLLELKKLPFLAKEILEEEKRIEEIASSLAEFNNFLYLGRGINYPTALEGALKLKELSYIHAEGYAGGEMKHGPIALIDEKFPVVALCPYSFTREKMLSNILEIKARKGKVVGIITEGDEVLKDMVDFYFPIPEIREELTTFLITIVLQLLAYHIAVKRGCDVDRPRNLAKSVTVE